MKYKEDNEIANESQGPGNDIALNDAHVFRIERINERHPYNS
jgi:hypothetical protein